MRYLLRNALPSEEGLTWWYIAGRQKGIGGDDTIEARLQFRRHTQTDQSAPVLYEQRDMLEVEPLYHLFDPIDMPFIGIVFTGCRFVRSSEAYQIGSDDAVACGNDRRNHFSVQIAPGGLAVEHQDRLGVSRSLIDIMNAYIVELDVVGCERVSRQVSKTLIGRAKNFHRVFLSFSLHSIPYMLLII